MDRLTPLHHHHGPAFAVRHRWGLAALAAALFLWAVGTVATPAPELVGGALVAVTGLAALGLARLRDPLHLLVTAGSGRTSLVLYCGSLALAGLFLHGLFTPSRSVVVANAPVTTATAFPPPQWMAALSASRVLAAERPALVPERATVPAPAAARDRDRLRVLSFNVWHGYPGSSAREQRYQRILDLARSADPDLVLLQEAWSTRRFGSLAQRLASDLGMGYAYARANGSLRYLGFEEGLAILSRHPITSARRLALAPRLPLWEMRAALGAVVTLPEGDTLEVWDLHLSHSDADARDGQARSLAAALESPSTVLLGGDFNAPASSAALATFSDLRFTPVLSEGIDHILASPAMGDRWTAVRTEAIHFGTVRDSRTGVTRPEVSDHPALLVELRRRHAAAAVAAGSS